MDLYQIIEDLVRERDRIQRIIQSLESVGGEVDRPKRGRPPGKPERPAVKRGRKRMDNAARKAVSARMKLYWAKRREEERASGS